jgi:hypothetical protein
VPEREIPIAFGNQFRIGPPQETLPESEIRKPGQILSGSVLLPGKRAVWVLRYFPIRQRKQLQYCRSSSKGLCYTPDEKQILRSGENILTSASTVFIDASLDIGEEVRGMLNLVEDDGRRVLIQESPRISNCSRSNIRRFKGDILALVTEQVLQCSSFTRLPGSCEDYSRKFLDSLFQNPFDASLNVVGGHDSSRTILCVFMHYNVIITQPCQGIVLLRK